jgi:hypothetical protein
VLDIMEAAGSPNISDFFPAVPAAELQGRQQLMDKLFARLHQVFDREVVQRMRGRSASEVRKTISSTCCSTPWWTTMARWSWTAIQYGQCSR